jgi:hypothetical protein
MAGTKTNSGCVRMFISLLLPIFSNKGIGSCMKEGGETLSPNLFSLSFKETYIGGELKRGEASLI